jgi:cytochrome c556
MFQVSTFAPKCSRFAVGSFVAALISALLVVFPPGSQPAGGQDRTPGLTGVDHPDDVVQARQLLMDGIDAEMADIDLAAGGKELKLADLQAHAFAVNTLLAAFPHLFPPQTKPVNSADGSPNSTAATLAVWQNFDDFYGRAQAAAATAFEAGQAKSLEQFRTFATTLRAACDGCHAAYMHVPEPSHP